jgi:hypothetical protein
MVLSAKSGLIKLTLYLEIGGEKIMKCKDCKACYKRFFESKPEEYVCIGVPEPFVIKDINSECTEYTDKDFAESNKTDENNKDTIREAVYKDGNYVCPCCCQSVFPLALFKGDYCVYCGQHVKWREIIKYRKE